VTTALRRVCHASVERTRGVPTITGARQHALLRQAVPDKAAARRGRRRGRATRRQVGRRATCRELRAERRVVRHLQRARPWLRRVPSRAPSRAVRLCSPMGYGRPGATRTSRALTSSSRRTSRRHRRPRMGWRGVADASAPSVRHGGAMGGAPSPPTRHSAPATVAASARGLRLPRRRPRRGPQPPAWRHSLPATRPTSLRRRRGWTRWLPSTALSLRLFPRFPLPSCRRSCFCSACAPARVPTTGCARCLSSPVRGW